MALTKIEESLQKIIEADNEIIFYDTAVLKENETTIFRVMIKRKNGNVSIEDCVKVHDLISPFLDVEEPLNGNYNLEVSSPGLERKLEKLIHWSLSIGEDLEITLKDKTQLSGKLISYNNENYTARIIQEDGNEQEIILANIKKALVIYKFLGAKK